MSKIVEVHFYKYNILALKQGLEQAGLDVSKLSDGELSNMLSHALGFIDYTDPKIVKELIENK